jgi:hypothetical protein
MSSPDDYNQKQIDSEKFTGEHLTKLTEFWQEEHFLTADGKCGPNTLNNILKNDVVDGIDDADTDPLIDIKEPFDGPLDYIPRTRKDVYAIFGDPSNGEKVNKAWEKENIRTFRKAMALPGVDPHRYVKIHKLAEPYMREAMRRAMEACPDYVIDKFACFNYRLMRSSNRLSYHSWGIAMDINPDDNPAIRYDSAADKPVPFSDEWHRLRPRAMPRAFIEAIKSAGFAWGGDWKTFADDMHFELVLP